MKTNFKKQAGQVLVGMALCISFLSANVEAASFDPARFQTVEANGLKIHSYLTNDALGDVCTVLETKTGLVLLESVPFYTREDELKAYMETLHKPLKGVIVSAHNGGVAAFDGVPVYASQATADELNKSIKGQLDSFKAFGGEDLDGRLVLPTKIMKDEKMSIEGIDFNIAYHDGVLPSMKLSIPKSKVLYTHMLGADEHSLITSREQLTNVINELKADEKYGYNIILSSHHKPEDGSAIKNKVAYLEKMQVVLATAKSADEFMTGMKTAYPDFKGLQYLNMTANFLFK